MPKKKLTIAEELKLRGHAYRAGIDADYANQVMHECAQEFVVGELEIKDEDLGEILVDEFENGVMCVRFESFKLRAAETLLKGLEGSGLSDREARKAVHELWVAMGEALRLAEASLESEGMENAVRMARARSVIKKGRKVGLKKISGGGGS